MSKITIQKNNDTTDTQRVPVGRVNNKVIQDLLYIYINNSLFINEKGYLQKLVELLYKLGYYNNNKSLFS